MVLKKLDAWWEAHSAGRRYDRGPMYFWTMVASLINGFSMILIGPSPNISVSELNDLEQKLLAWTLFIGSAIAVFAATTGSRFWFPNFTRVQSYMVGLLGIPLVTASYLFYSYAIAMEVQDFTSALGGVLIFCVAIGTIINGLFFYLETRRIIHNLKFIKGANPSFE